MHAALPVFTRQLATLLEGGWNLRDSLHLCEQETLSPRLARALGGVRADLERGHSLATALRRQPEAFSPVYVTTVRAGERSGNLDWALGRLASLLERDLAWRNQLRLALLYPTAALLIALGVMAVLFIWVVPMYVQYLQGMNLQVPLPTRVLIGLNSLVHRPVLVPTILILGLSAWVLAPCLAGRRWDAVRLSIPVFGPLHRLVSLSRLCRTLGSMLAAGVPLLPALELSGGASGNRVMQDGMVWVRTRVEAGERLGESMVAARLLPPVAMHLVAVGEESGTLDAMLLRVADVLDMDLSHRVARCMVLAEPAILVGLALLLFAMGCAMTLPLYCPCGNLG